MQSLYDLNIIKLSFAKQHHIKCMLIIKMPVYYEYMHKQSKHQSPVKPAAHLDPELFAFLIFLQGLLSERSGLRNKSIQIGGTGGWYLAGPLVN